MALIVSSHLSIYFLLACIVVSCVVIRRLVLHPLVKFPGPRLAASTSLYKSYYEIVKGGDLLHQLDKLHEVYGEVVRIGPNELHFKDYRVYNKIFAVNTQLLKDPDFYTCFGVDASTFGCIDPDKARTGRELLSPHFNRRAIIQLEGIIHSKVEKLCQRLADNAQSSDMFFAFRCATMDIITAHCFGRCVNNLDEADFRAPLLVDIQTAVPLLWKLKSFPWILPVIPLLPRCMTGTLFEQYNAFLRVRAFVTREIQHISEGIHDGTPQSPQSIYHHLLGRSSAALELNPESPTRLVHEALSLIQAGSDTVANTCVVGAFHVLRNPLIRAKLVKVLQTAWPDPTTRVGLRDLEKIPYLTAVIKESLRMSHGFVSPLPRVVGPLGTELGYHQIPPGTTVGISATAVHNNAELFPLPNEFSPERWLGSRNLNPYLVPFSKGPRMCLGINMAWAELYIFFGMLFRKLDMTLVDTSHEDLTDFQDFFIPIHKGRHLQVRANMVKA